jgi:hypothetical protein
MSTITLSLSDRQMRGLRKRARKAGVKVEEYAQSVLVRTAESPEDEVLDATSPEFRREADYVAKKNAELYRRLA